MADELLDQWHDLLFGVRRSIRYHYKRRQFFDRVNKTSSILSALSGSATIISLLAKAGPEMTAVFAGIVAISGTINIVIGTASAARVHHDLAKRFMGLEKKMVAAGEPTRDLYCQLINERLDIEAEESTPLQILDTICHNELITALGYDNRYKIQLTRLQRLAAPFFDIGAHKLSLNQP